MLGARHEGFDQCEIDCTLAMDRCATLVPMSVDSELQRRIERELPSLTLLRRDLHAHPELGLCETRTSAAIQRELQEIGVEFQAGVGGGTGVIAHIPGSSGKSIGLRADIDALPIMEETQLAYCSTIPGLMHACGHDGHTTILVGVARVLAELARAAPLPRPVTLLFQPAEENLGGATLMIEDGCLTGRLGPPLEALYGLHCWPWLGLGSIGVRNGPILATTDSFSIRVQGRGSHAAWPHLAHDPVVAVAAIINALQTIVSRRTDPLDSVVVSVCVVRAGDAFNVIPQDAVLEGTFRALTAESREKTRAGIEEIAQQGAKMHGCTATMHLTRGCPATVNDPGATDAVRRAVHQMPSATLVEMQRPFMGGEDFGSYAERLPASFFLLGIQEPNGAQRPALHHPTFDFNDSAIALGIEAMCRLALADRAN